MAEETDRVVVFIDGQNLFHLARDAWGGGYHWPKYDPIKIAKELVSLKPHRTLAQVRFYSGVPDLNQSEFWHKFWLAKIRTMKSLGVWVFQGKIRNGQEKGVDVKIALDIVRLARQRAFETAIVVSQDADLNEALREALDISRDQGWLVALESAFPYEDNRGLSKRGLTPSTWRRIDRSMYDRCIDPHDYRPKRVPPPTRPLTTLKDLKRKFNK